eukprot:TRINITY_DN16467_c0_g1_i1.p2 TRINITY_DN16467_c0_g1~~TRINITY_DN16467_c0_g1_i1.p2  ORF type:complete len:62 (-),score=12.04 TRINITY_DN16467_c0_g1_i1:44-229(-)
MCLITNLCKENLQKLIERERDMDMLDRTRILCDIAGGMSHLHDVEKVLHRDLKSQKYIGEG